MVRAITGLDGMGLDSLEVGKTRATGFAAGRPIYQGRCLVAKRGRASIRQPIVIAAFLSRPRFAGTTRATLPIHYGIAI
jgi:hypothetical protein